MYRILTLAVLLALPTAGRAQYGCAGFTPQYAPASYSSYSSYSAQTAAPAVDLSLLLQRLLEVLAADSFAAPPPRPFHGFAPRGYGYDSAAFGFAPRFDFPARPFAFDSFSSYGFGGFPAVRSFAFAPRFEYPVRSFAFAPRFEFAPRAFAPRFGGFDRPFALNVRTSGGLLGRRSTDVRIGGGFGGPSFVDVNVGRRGGLLGGLLGGRR